MTQIDLFKIFRRQLPERTAREHNCDLERIIGCLNDTYLRPTAKTADMDKYLTHFVVSQYDDSEELTISSVTRVKCAVE